MRTHEWNRYNFILKSEKKRTFQDKQKEIPMFDIYLFFLSIFFFLSSLYIFLYNAYAHDDDGNAPAQNNVSIKNAFLSSPCAARTRALMDLGKAARSWEYAWVTLVTFTNWFVNLFNARACNALCRPRSYIYI